MDGLPRGSRPSTWHEKPASFSARFLPDEGRAIKRRDFIAICAAAAWPPEARAQQPDRMRRIGVLMAHPESDPEFQQYADTFREGLRKLGWIEGRNVSFNFRWGALDDADIRSRSAKLQLAKADPPCAR